MVLFGAVVVAALPEWRERVGRERAMPTGWVLNRDPQTIKVEAVYRLFVFRADARMPTLDSDPELEALVHEISARVVENIKMSIDELSRSTSGTGTPVAPARIQAV